MTEQEYEQKKRECWEEFKRTNLDGEVQWQPVNRYDVFCAAFDRAYALGKQEKDAEGEEMLTVKRSDVINEFDKLHKLSYIAADLQLGLNAFRTLFGSKCLPDELNEDNFATKKPKPAEPKFKHKIGDKVRIVNDISHNNKYKGDITEIVYVDESNPNTPYKVEKFGVGLWCRESDLEPYTEPKNEGTRQEQCVPKNAESGTHSFNHILKDGFRNERRLNIATQITASIYSDYETVGRFRSIEALVRKALNIADTLIFEAEKGGDNA